MNYFLETITRTFLFMMMWLITSALSTKVIVFLSKKIFSYEIVEMNLFTPLFCFVVLFFLIFNFIFGSWLKEYKKQIELGIERKKAFDNTFDNVKLSPPKIIMKIIEPFLYRMLLFY